MTSTKSKDNKCKNQAKYLVPWSGRQLKCCEKHAKELSILGNAIGLSVQVAEVAMLDKCEMLDDLEDK